MPRLKKFVWQHFINDTDRRVRCKHCSITYSDSNVCRLEKHIMKCPKFKYQDPSYNAAVCAATNSNKTEELLAKAIFTSGTSLSIVESPLWREWIESIAPAYKFPSRKSLSTTYLDAVYKEMKSEVDDKIISAINLHLQCDNWSDDGQTFKFIILTPKPVFVKNINTLTNHHTDEYLSNEIIKIMENYGVDKFTSVIGDNSENIQKVFSMVKNKYPHIVTLECITHRLNLLFRDVFMLRCESIDNLISTVLDIVTSIKKSESLNTLLMNIIKEKKSGEFFNVPIKMQGDSFIKMLQNVQNIEASLQTLAICKEANLPSIHKNHLLDKHFWGRIEESIQILEPITKTIFILESNTNNIHKVYPFLKSVKSSLINILPNLQYLGLDETSRESIKDSITARLQDCIKPIHLAAHMLDPEKQGRELEEVERLQAIEFIEELADKYSLTVTCDIMNYLSRNDLWQKPILWKNINLVAPVDWWRHMCSSKPLSKIAARILTAPCTSASFDLLSNVDTEKMNGLSTKKVGKIDFIRWNWNMLEENKGKGMFAQDQDDMDMDDSTNEDYCAEGDRDNSANEDNCTEVNRVETVMVKYEPLDIII